MRKDIRISVEAKNKFDELNTKEKFSTASECIIQICNFFEENNFSPKDKIGVKTANSFNELEKVVKVELMLLKEFIKTDSQSLRRRHGAIEKEYFIPLNRKISEIDSKLNSKEKSEKEENDELEKLHLKQKEIDELQKKIRETTRILKRISENLSIENLQGRNYPIVNLEEYELENIVNYTALL
jgi:predicted RNase H-like nuclease (RuvC/YqgF family)